MARRVLVVDDVEEMRVLIRRVLSAGGYEVDLAATIAQARSLDPAGYDAVLVDAHLGAERGADLIDWLRARDRAAAARCLIVTGGSAAELPAGVTCLTKPFRPDELLAAVRAIEPAASPGDGRAAGAVPATRRPGPSSAGPEQTWPVPVPPPQPVPAPAGPTETARPATQTDGTSLASPWQLLSAVARSRAAERQRLADFLHDGPVQELTAAVLELQLISQDDAGPGNGSGPDPRTGPLLQRLETAAGALRWLVDRGWPDPVPPGGLPAAVQQRTAELLTTPATVDVSGPPELGEPAGTDWLAHATLAYPASPAAAAALAAPVAPATRAERSAGPAEVPLIADLVELMLTEAGAADQPAQAHVVLRLGGGQIQAELTLSPAGAGQELGDGTAARAAIGRLAEALRATAATEFSPQRWRARLTLRRDAA